MNERPTFVLTISDEYLANSFPDKDGRHRSALSFILLDLAESFRHSPIEGSGPIRGEDLEVVGRWSFDEWPDVPEGGLSAMPPRLPLDAEEVDA